MQTYVIACKLIDLHAFWNILEHSACILEHSACILEHSACLLENPTCILEHSGTFRNFLHAVWNILHAFWYNLEHSGTFWNSLEHSGTFWNILLLHWMLEFQLVHRQTDTHTQTDIRTYWAASSQLKIAGMDVSDVYTCIQGQVISECGDTPCELSRGGSRAWPKMSWYNIDHPGPRPRSGGPVTQCPA